jgi:hypothetical protein
LLASHAAFVKEDANARHGLLLPRYTPKAYCSGARAVLTIVESPLFSRLWPDYWTEAERGEFCAFLACRPEAGDVIPGSGGCRKVRWSRPGTGKRGGVRIVYTVRLAAGELVLLVMYAKSARDNIPAHVLRKIAEEMSDASP